MVFDNPFEAPGEWLKGNLHTHTTLSDGQQSPQERVAAYQARGYDFLALTDHDRLADPSALAPTRLLVLRGIEVVCANPTGGPWYHLVGLGLPASFRVPRSKQIQTTVDAINDARGLAIIAHPYWTGQNIKDLEIVQGFAAVEVFNTTCEVTIGKGTSSVYWDDLLSQGRRVFGLAVDDAHSATHDVFQGWVMAKCAERSVEGVMQALASGRFYATCGPAIESVTLDGGRLAVRTSPVACIRFLCNGAQGRLVRGDDGSPVTAGEFAPRGNEVYARVECTDARGRSAWTNPVFLR